MEDSKGKARQSGANTCIFPIIHSTNSVRQTLSLLLSRTKLVLSYRYSPSGSPSVFVFMTLSRADLKSAICTRILRSLRAMRPASEQIALISAPERSSFWLINSSRSTSSFRDIFEVCRAKILRLVFSLNVLALSRPRIKQGSTYDRDSQKGSSYRFFRGE